MALDASHVLDSPQIAGVVVNPRGTTRRRARAGGGVGAGAGPAGIIGGMIGSRLASGKTPRPSDGTPSETPPFGGYLAVTDDELALIKVKSGLVRLRLEEVVARVPRNEVASAELGRGLALPLTITFANGGRWEWEVPWPSKKHAEDVVDALGGSH